MKQHTSPCKECPFKRNSASGWLGDSTPEEFISTADSDARMPCHMVVDYDRDDWENQIAHSPRCAGRAIYLRNRCKSPRDKNEREFTQSVGQDVENVFQWPSEFIEHHTL